MTLKLKKQDFFIAVKGLKTSRKLVSGYVFSMHGFDFGVRKTDARHEPWVVTELKSGFETHRDVTRAMAVEFWQMRFEKMGAERVAAAVGNALSGLGECRDIQNGEPNA